MNYDTIIAIDPGALGGIAIWRDECVKVVKMPKDIRLLSELLSYYKEIGNPIVIVERVQARPDDVRPDGSGVNMGKMYRVQKMIANFEQIKATIRLSNIPYMLVHPLTWQARLGIRRKGEEKSERKKRYREEAAALYPQICATMWNCDALLIMHFARIILERDIAWAQKQIVKEQESATFW